MEENINPAQIPVPQQELVVVLELVAEEGEQDPALLNTLGRETIATLQLEGYRALPPVYTGQKGVESFFVEFIAPLQQVAGVVWSNHAVIAEGIANLSGLVTIFGSILPMLKRIRQAHEQQAKKQVGADHPIKLTVEIDGSPVVVEASDIAQADAALKLALKYHSVYPGTATQVTMKSKVKIRGRIPARKRRSRR